MNIDIPGKTEDYFTETEGGKYKANRERLRALVAIRNLRLQEVIKEGGNPHQASLDLNDQFDQFISSAPPYAQVAIYETYTEELNASSASMLDEANRMNSEVAATEEKNNLLGQLAGVVIIIIIAVIVISNL